MVFRYVFIFSFSFIGKSVSYNKRKANPPISASISPQLCQTTPLRVLSKKNCDFTYRKAVILFLGFTINLSRNTHHWCFRNFKIIFHKLPFYRYEKESQFSVEKLFDEINFWYSRSSIVCSCLHGKESFWMASTHSEIYPFREIEIGKLCRIASFQRYSISYISQSQSEKIGNDSNKWNISNKI